jgi:hypothetical protein
MRTFVDREGRNWKIEINVSVVKRVRSLTGVNLLDVLGERLAEELANDPILLCDVLYAVCRPQADELGVSDEDFGRGLGGNAIEQATDALLEELVDFFPSRKGALLRKASARMKELEGKICDLAEQRLEDPRLEQKIEALFETALDGPSTESPSSGSSGSSPGSSASTPPG